MKILVVGGAGYLGGAVIDCLVNPGPYIPGPEHEFTVYDALVYEDSYRKKVPFVRGDIRDMNKLKR